MKHTNLKNVEAAIDYVNTQYDAVDLAFNPYGIAVFTLGGNIFECITLDDLPSVSEMQLRAVRRQQLHQSIFESMVKKGQKIIDYGQVIKNLPKP